MITRKRIENRGENMKISVVIPFYNEERMIEKMYSELVHVLDQQTTEEFFMICFLIVFLWLVFGIMGIRRWIRKQEQM